MASQQALALWQSFRDAPVKQIDMPLRDRRDAGEHAEDPTAEPAEVVFRDAPEVGGLWAVPPDARDGAAILYLFGGGYVLGSPASRRKTAGHLALASSTRVLVPNYRLAPEHKFPAPVEDACRAYTWLLSREAEPSRVVVMGDSAGGGLAVATLIALRDSGSRSPAGCVGLSPWADLTCSGQSMDTAAAVDVECTRSGLLEMAGWYLNGSDPRSPTASPVFADLSRLAPMLMVVGGDEVLLDDSVRLCRASAQAGGTATLHVVGDMQHVFPIWAGAIPEADAAVALIGGWVRDRTS